MEMRLSGDAGDNIGETGNGVHREGYAGYGVRVRVRVTGKGTQDMNSCSVHKI